jgi:hypothetical protein
MIAHTQIMDGRGVPAKWLSLSGMRGTYRMRSYLIVKEQSRACPSTIRFIFEVKPDPSFKKICKYKSGSIKLLIEPGAAAIYYATAFIPHA